MITRTRRRLVTFAQPFLLRDMEGVMPPGMYFCLTAAAFVFVAMLLLTDLHL
jgi:hypothetical protein